MGATTAHRSTTELLTLHAVRLKGMADDGEVAARFALDRSESDELLLDFEAYGWVTRVDFAGTGGWTLTAAGRREDERRLADELAAVGAAEPVHDAYRSSCCSTGACSRPAPSGSCGRPRTTRSARTTTPTSCGTSTCSPSWPTWATSSSTSPRG